MGARNCRWLAVDTAAAPRIQRPGAASEVPLEAASLPQASKQWGELRRKAQPFPTVLASSRVRTSSVLGAGSTAMTGGVSTP